jgi:hypothetical protein
MSFYPVSNISIIGVSDKGNLESERVILKVLKDCNLVNYVVVDATYNDDNSISDRNRHIFWFPNWAVKQNDYVLLYTKPNQERFLRTIIDKQGRTIHSFYWGMKKTVWNQNDDAVTLMNINRVSFKNV